MDTTADRLNFAVRFAQMDLDRLRPGDWLNLYDDLKAFLGQEREIDPASMGGMLVDARDLPATADEASALLQDLQTETRRMLGALCDARSGMAAGEPCPLPSLEWNLVNWARVVGADFITVHVAGLTREVYLVLLFQLLKDEPTDRIRRCPECRTIFLRVRKQQYCSRTCTNRANMRQWRKTQKGRARESDDNHERYHARQKRRLGPNVRVARRPRSDKGGQ